MNDSKRPFYKQKRFYLLSLIALYLLFGFFYVPKLINANLKQQLADQLGMEATIEATHFNPLTFSSELEGLALTDQQANDWFQADSLGINFNPVRLLWGQWHFSDFALTQPKITIHTEADGRLAIPFIPPIEPGPEDAEPLNLVVDGIVLEQGSIDILANHINDEFHLSVRTLAIEHDTLRLDEHDTNFTIKLVTHDDEELNLTGTYNHGKQQINSQFSFNEWLAGTVNRVLPSSLGLENQNGDLSGAGQITWDLTSVPMLQIDELNVSEWSAQWQQLTVNDMEASITGIQIDPLAQQININQIESDQADWQVLMPMTFESSAGEGSNDQGPAWQVNVNQISIEEWPIEYQDALGQLPVRITSLSITELQSVDLSAQTEALIMVGDQGQLNLNGQFNVNQGNNQLDWRLADLTLAELSPWITDATGLVVTEGTLDTQHSTRFDDSGFATKGALTIKQLKTENQAGQAIADFGQINIANSEVDSHKREIIIDDIILDQANGNLIIDENKALNIQNLNPDEDQAETEPAGDATPWVIKIGEINLNDASTALTDHSINPTVTTQITELSGQIKGLSSESLSKADVALTGKFNQFSAVSIQGQINPLSSTAYTDLDITVDDLDLLPYSPYASTYLAFPLQGGKLNLALKYNLNQFELKGDNKLLFKQLKFGDKVNAPNAVDLPLKLAVSLLTDGKGEMKIDLPVAGNINDPTFSYGGLVGKAIFKLITNIVASPFKLLGKLIPNPDPNLSDIMFTAGSAELLESEQNKLNQIASILAQKPELKLQLNPHTNLAFDETGLKQQLLLNKAPFTNLDLLDAEVQAWLEAQLTPEELATYRSGADPVTVNHQAIWDTLLNRQTVTAEAMSELTGQRNLAIKNHLIEQAGIASENIFIEQAQGTEQAQAMIKVGVTH